MIYSRKIPKKGIIVLIVSVLLLGFVLAQHPSQSSSTSLKVTQTSTTSSRSDGYFAPDFIFQKFDDELGLTDAQVAKIDALFETVYRNQMRNGAIDDHRQLEALTFSDTFDADKASAIIDQRLASRKALMLEMAQAKQQAWKVLNSEQKTKLKNIQARFSERMEKRIQSKYDWDRNDDDD